MVEKMIRVLIVDDSHTTNQLLARYIGAEGDMEVVGIAFNGLEAIEKVSQLKPDIVVMDVSMPVMNGFEATKEIMQENPTPILLISSVWNLTDIKIALKGMGIGALSALEKPRGVGHPDFRRQMDDLIEHVRLLSKIKAIRRFKDTKEMEVLQKLESAGIDERAFKLVVIGASTGGPPVLSEILEELPLDYPLPILVVQHMSKGFMENFVSWLRVHCVLNVKIAVDGELLQGGNVYFGEDSHHLTIENGRVKFRSEEPGDAFVPSASKLFSSAAGYRPKETVAIILTGMGKDGASEMKLLNERGAFTIAQNAESSVVFGMAQEAIKLGGVDIVLSPKEIKEVLHKYVFPKARI